MTTYDLGAMSHDGFATFTVTIAARAPLGSFTMPGSMTWTPYSFGGAAELVLSRQVWEGYFDAAFQWPNTADPSTGREEYRLVIVDSGGTAYCELENATINSVVWALSEFGGVDFNLPMDDPKAAECMVPQREVQVWRGTQLIHWCVLVRARSDDQTVNFQAVSLDWYLQKRIMGPVPRKGKFGSVGFEAGIGMWDYTYLPGSKYVGVPAHSASNVVVASGDGSLAMSPSLGVTRDTRGADSLFTSSTSTTLSGGGNGIIDSITNATFGANPNITVVVYHDNTLSSSAAQKLTDDRADAIEARIHAVKPEAQVRAYGRGEKAPTATNSTSAGRTANRRAVFSYRNDDGKKGHLQYAGQKYTIKVPAKERKARKATFRAWVYIEEFTGPAGNNWGLVLERQHPTTLSKNPKYAARGYKKVLSRAVVKITKNTPTGKWVRMEASLSVPADGRSYVLEGRMFSPAGLAYWDEADLFTDDGLRYVDEEESVIIEGLIDHAQDTSIGKSTLNFKKQIVKTGVKRTRTYTYASRDVIYDLLAEFPTLINGSEWTIVTTPDARTFTTYYPRKGADRNYSLQLGRNIASLAVDVDAEQTADQVVIYAYESEGASREERSVSDPTLLDGLILEKAYEGQPGSSIGTMYGQAVRGIERYRKPVVLPDLTSHPSYLSEILANLSVGDRVPIDVRKGWFQGYGNYRITQMSLDPQTDQITFTVTPEDQKVVTLLSWAQPGWKYKAQSQIAKTGDGNSLPSETDVAYAARTFDDSSWSTGQAPFGWSVNGSQFSGSGETPINTTIPTKNEVWLRRTVLCTEEMYLVIKHDNFTYMYVNGHRLDLSNGQPYVKSDDFGNKNPRGPFRVPSEFLDPSGRQVIAMHTQDKLADYGGIRPDAFVADMMVRGIYNPDHVK